MIELLFSRFYVFNGLGHNIMAMAVYKGTNSVSLFEFYYKAN